MEKNEFFKKFIPKNSPNVNKRRTPIGYPSIAAISDTVEELSINTTLKESSLGFKDILLLFLV
jgi:hypothetical protein